MQMTPIEFILKLPHIESVNSMYEPIIRWTKAGTQIFDGMRLTDSAAKMKDLIIHQVDALQINSRKFDLRHPFRIQLIFVMNKNILKRDLDNLQKLTQDGIFTSLRLNDSRIFEIRSRKILYKDSKNEFIKVRIDQLPESIEDMNVE